MRPLSLGRGRAGRSGEAPSCSLEKRDMPSPPAVLPWGGSVELGTLRHLDLGRHLTRTLNVQGERAIVLFG